MKKIFIAIAVLAVCALAACSDDQQTTWDEYSDWRELNDRWLDELKAKRNPDGTPYYTEVIPRWNPGTYVLMHYFNDPAENAGNLSPLYTSVVDVRYVGHDANGAGFDSSTLVTQYGRPGVARFNVNSVIQGWGIALERMHVGDTVELIVPYGAAYGSSINSGVKPYSNLRFNIRLEDIYKYEARP